MLVMETTGESKSFLIYNTRPLFTDFVHVIITSYIAILVSVVIGQLFRVMVKVTLILKFFDHA